MKYLILAIAFFFSGCSELEYGFALDADHLMMRNDTAKLDALKREEFRLHLAHVIDMRSPSEKHVKATSYDKIYEYDPNQFLQGMPLYLEHAMQNRIHRLSSGTVDLYVDLEVKDFRLWISKGNFLSSSYGHYKIETAMNMVVRDAASNILFTQELEYEDAQNRPSYKGHHPTAEMDARVMKKLTKEAISELIKDIGWYTHRAFNNQRKYYHPEAFEREFETYSEGKGMIPAS